MRQEGIACRDFLPIDCLVVARASLGRHAPLTTAFCDAPCLQSLMAFGDPLHWMVWMVLFFFIIVAGLFLMLVEGYGDNESLPLHPWGLTLDCMCVDKRV